MRAGHAITALFGMNWLAGASTGISMAHQNALWQSIVRTQELSHSRLAAEPGAEATRTRSIGMMRLRGGAWVAEDVRGFCVETGPFLEEYALLVRRDSSKKENMCMHTRCRRGGMLVPAPPAWTTFTNATTAASL
jgi:hypothetical protein